MRRTFATALSTASFARWCEEPRPTRRFGFGGGVRRNTVPTRVPNTPLETS